MRNRFILRQAPRKGFSRKLKVISPINRRGGNCLPPRVSIALNRALPVIITSLAQLSERGNHIFDALLLFEQFLQGRIHLFPGESVDLQAFHPFIAAG